MMKSGTLLCALAAAGLFSIPAWATPYVDVRMVVNGGPQDGQSVLTVNPGQTVSYRLVAQIAPVGTTNSAFADNSSISSITSETNPGKDGIITVRFNIFQCTNAPVQVDFFAPAIPTYPYNTGPGSSGGKSMSRGNGYSNLIGFSAVVFASLLGGRGVTNSVCLGTGSFTVAGDALIGASSTIQMDWQGCASYRDVGTFDPIAAGAFKINDGKQITRTRDASVEEVVFGYSGLTLTTVPEPASIGLVLLGLGLLCRK